MLSMGRYIRGLAAATNGAFSHAEARHWWSLDRISLVRSAIDDAARSSCLRLTHPTRSREVLATAATMPEMGQQRQCHCAAAPLR